MPPKAGRRKRFRRKWPASSRAVRKRYWLTRQPSNFKIVRTTTPSTYASGFSSVAASDVFGSLQFSLNELPNYLEFAALFDSYRIDKVQVTFIPVNNQQITSTSGTLYIPSFYMVTDYDDAVTPGTIAELKEYADCKVIEGNKKIVKTIYPKVSMAIYNTALTTGYARPTRMLQQNLLLDCANNAIPHYGLKFAFDYSSTSAIVRYTITVKYYLTFYGLR